MVYCLFVRSAAFSSPPRNHATGLIGPSSLKKSVGREGIEPPQPKAADLQSAELTTLLNLPAMRAQMQFYRSQDREPPGRSPRLRAARVIARSTSTTSATPK